MSVVHSSIAIAAPPASVWAVVMDPRRFGEWVTIHRELRAFSDGPVREGATMEQTLHLRGTDIRVHWLLVECREPNFARWEGRGPARSSQPPQIAAEIPSIAMKVSKMCVTSATDQLQLAAVSSARKPLEQVTAPVNILLIGSQNTLKP